MVWLSWVFLSWVLLPIMSLRVTHVWWCQAKPHFLSLSAWWPLRQIPWLGLIRETPQGLTCPPQQSAGWAYPFLHFHSLCPENWILSLRALSSCLQNELLPWPRCCVRSCGRRREDPRGGNKVRRVESSDQGLTTAEQDLGPCLSVHPSVHLWHSQRPKC